MSSPSHTTTATAKKQKTASLACTGVLANPTLLAQILRWLSRDSVLVSRSVSNYWMYVCNLDCTQVDNTALAVDDVFMWETPVDKLRLLTFTRVFGRALTKFHLCLQFGECSDHDLVAVAKNCPNLTSFLFFSFGPFDVTPNVLEAIAPLSLTSLSFDGPMLSLGSPEDFLALLNSLSQQLVSLYLRPNSHLPSTAAMLAACPQLTALTNISLVADPHAEDELASPPAGPIVTARHPSLTSLQVCNFALTDEHLEQLKLLEGTLECLNLDCSLKGVTGSNWPSFVQDMPLLKKLQDDAVHDDFANDEDGQFYYDDYQEYLDQNYPDWIDAQRIIMSRLPSDVLVLPHGKTIMPSEYGYSWARRSAISAIVR